jgi:hypothetical protein
MTSFCRLEFTNLEIIHPALVLEGDFFSLESREEVDSFEPSLEEDLESFAEESFELESFELESLEPSFEEGSLEEESLESLELPEATSDLDVSGELDLAA